MLRHPTTLSESALRLEELREQRPARFLLHTTTYLETMIQTRVAYEIAERASHPCLFVVGAEHQPPQLREHDRTGALRARLERDVERRVGQPVGALGAEGALNHEQLGVGRGVVPLDRLVVRGGDHPTVPHHNGAHGNLIPPGRPTGLQQRRLHPRLIVQRRLRPAPPAAPFGSAGSRFSTATRSNTRPAPSFERSTRTVSPSVYSPSSTAMASGFCSSRWIARFSGRAPYTGS